MAWWFEDVHWWGTEGCEVKHTESKNQATVLEKNSEVILWDAREVSSGPGLAADFPMWFQGRNSKGNLAFTEE